MNVLYPSPPKNVAYNFSIVYQNGGIFLGKLYSLVGCRVELAFRAIVSSSSKQKALVTFERY